MFFAFVMDEIADVLGCLSFCVFNHFNLDSLILIRESVLCFLPVCDSLILIRVSMLCFLPVCKRRSLSHSAIVRFFPLLAFPILLRVSNSSCFPKLGWFSPDLAALILARVSNEYFLPSFAARILSRVSTECFRSLPALLIFIRDSAECLRPLPAAPIFLRDSAECFRPNQRPTGGFSPPSVVFVSCAPRCRNTEITTRSQAGHSGTGTAPNTNKTGICAASISLRIQQALWVASPSLTVLKCSRNRRCGLSAFPIYRIVCLSGSKSAYKNVVSPINALRRVLDAPRRRSGDPAVSLPEFLTPTPPSLSAGNPAGLSVQRRYVFRHTVEKFVLRGSESSRAFVRLHNE